MLSFNRTTQNTSILAFLANAPKEAKARSKQSGLNLLNAKQPQTGAQAIMASLRARGVDVHRLDAKAKETIRQRGAVIDKVAGGNIKTIDDIKNLTAGDDGLQVSGIKDLKDDKGQSLRGAATTDGKILLDKNLENKPAAMKATAIEEIGERTFQDIAKTQTNVNKRLPTATKEGLSTGDFGAEIAKRVMKGGNEADFKQLRNAKENDTITINGKTAEAAISIQDLKKRVEEQTKKNKTKKTNNTRKTKSTSRQNNINLNDLYHNVMQKKDVHELTHYQDVTVERNDLDIYKFSRPEEKHVFSFTYLGKIFIFTGDSSMTSGQVQISADNFIRLLQFSPNLRRRVSGSQTTVFKFNFTNNELQPVDDIRRYGRFPTRNGIAFRPPTGEHRQITHGQIRYTGDLATQQDILYHFVADQLVRENPSDVRREQIAGRYQSFLQQYTRNFGNSAQFPSLENQIEVIDSGTYTRPSQGGGAGPSGTPPPENNTISPPDGYENCREVNAPGGYFLPIQCDKKK